MRQFRLILRTASAQLSGRPRQTLLVTLGVAVGASVMIVTFALTNGIIESIKEKIINVSPHITITGERLSPKDRILTAEGDGHAEFVSRIVPDEEKEIKPYAAVLSLLENIPSIDAVSPFVQARGVLRKGKAFRQVALRGVDPRREALIAGIGKNIIAGSLEELAATPAGILLGSGLAKRLTAKLHDVVRLTGEGGRVTSLTVRGIFSSGFAASDDNTAFINLPLGQAISGVSSTVASGIGLHTTDIDGVGPLARMIEERTGYRAETWDEANANLLTVFKRNNYITLLLVVFVFMVSGLGIANTLVTLVLQKQKDIAIMKSIGFSARSIQGLFLVQGLAIGLAGTVLGLAAGYELTGLVASLPVSFGENAVVRSDTIPVVRTAGAYVITACFSVVVSVVASLAPARRAAALKPVQILRG
jgi:lipoprotein-releasing system permease protein